MARDAYHTFVLALAPWMNHHTTCSRAIVNDSCDCGLYQLLAELKREAEHWHAENETVVTKTGQKRTHAKV